MFAYLRNIIFNNFFLNFLIRLFGIEKFVVKQKHLYRNFKTNENGSIQENAGYSLRPEINEVLEKSRADFKATIAENCIAGSTILDIGCGPGMYLSLLKDNNYNLFATDINKSMIDAAKKESPSTTFLLGDFMSVQLNAKFNFIYCIGVLIYIPRSSIHKFFEKIYHLLEKDGILYLNYPHAISVLDILYNDITYVQYSPKRIEEWIRPYFNIIKHEHAFDGRKIELYDKSPYQSLNPNTNRTYKNSYLLIAKKK